MAVRIRLDPPEPRAAIEPSGRKARLGAIMEEMRLFSGQTWKPKGLRSSSPSMLFSMMPVPGSMAPQPSPLDRLKAATLPAASTTLRCVVPRALAACPATSRR